MADSGTSNGLLTHVTLHFRTMSNNKTHPRGKFAGFPLFFPCIHPSITMQLANQLCL